MPCWAVGCGCASPNAAIALVMTRSCSRPRYRRAPAKQWSTAVRVGGIKLTLVELAPQLAALAAENARLNGLSAQVAALDVAAPARAFAAAGLRPEQTARVLMNPPFNDPARQRASPDRGRRLAHVAPRATLGKWTRTAARLLRPRGTLS